MDKLSYTEYNLTQDKKLRSRRFVDFKNNWRDKLCVKLVAKDKSNALITRLTGYSAAQIHYRAVWAGVNRKDYRNNNKRSPYTKMILGLDERNEQEYDRLTDQYLERVCPEMYKIVKLQRSNKP